VAAGGSGDATQFGWTRAGLRRCEQQLRPVQGDAFIEFEAELEGEHVWHFVLGRSDPNEQLIALYHDPRPTSRLYRMTFTGDDWALHRQDPDFHQRFVASVSADRIQGPWDASEDQGATWHKDFDLTFERTATRISRPAPAQRSNERKPRTTPAVLNSTRSSGSAGRTDDRQTTSDAAICAGPSR